MEKPGKLVKRTLIREVHLQHSECREHSHNSRIKQAAGVEMTVSAKDAKITAASSDFLKHSQNSLSKGEPNVDPGEVKATFGDPDGQCLRTVSEFQELSPNSPVVTEASEGRHQHTKPVCVGETREYSQDSLGVGNNYQFQVFHGLKACHKLLV